MSQTMIAKSLAITPMAMISRWTSIKTFPPLFSFLFRPVCGIYQQTLIINLPGSSKGCVVRRYSCLLVEYFIFLFAKECVDFVYPILRHAIDLIQNKRADVAATHSAMQGKVRRSIHWTQEKSIFYRLRENIIPVVVIMIIIIIMVCINGWLILKKFDCWILVHTGRKGERLRQSPFPMISVDDALKLIFEQTYKMPIIERPLTGNYMPFEIHYLILNFRMFGLYLRRRNRRERTISAFSSICERWLCCSFTFWSISWTNLRNSWTFRCRWRECKLKHTCFNRFLINHFSD